MRKLNNKLWFTIIIISLTLLAACSDNTPDLSVEKVPAAVVNEKSAEDLKKEFKEKGIEVSFVDVNTDKYEEQSYFKLTGEVGTVGTDDTGSLQEFILNTTEDRGGQGVYLIQSMPSKLDSEMDIEEGETITVYGKYQGKDEENSMPLVFVQVIEK